MLLKNSNDQDLVQQNKAIKEDLEHNIKVIRNQAQHINELQDQVESLTSVLQSAKKTIETLKANGIDVPHQLKSVIDECALNVSQIRNTKMELAQLHA